MMLDERRSIHAKRVAKSVNAIASFLIVLSPQPSYPPPTQAKGGDAFSSPALPPVTFLSVRECSFGVVHE
jgi:hypothetical protein